MRPQVGADGPRHAGAGKDATFGQRRSNTSSSYTGKRPSRDNKASIAEDGGMEMSWVPSGNFEDADEASSRGGRGKGGKHPKRGVEMFGAGMEKGGEAPIELAESDRKGRSHRRQGTRSGSKNVFRRM